MNSPLPLSPNFFDDDDCQDFSDIIRSDSFGLLQGCLGIDSSGVESDWAAWQRGQVQAPYPADQVRGPGAHGAVPSGGKQPVVKLRRGRKPKPRVPVEQLESLLEQRQAQFRELKKENETLQVRARMQASHASQVG